MLIQSIGTILRALLAAYGGSALLSDTELEQAVGAAAVLVTIAWGVYQKYQAREAK